MIEHILDIPCPVPVTDILKLDSRLYIACNDGHIRVYNTETSQYEQDVEAHKFGVNRIVGDRYSEYLFTAGDDGYIHIWDKSLNHISSLQGHTSYVQTLAIDQKNLLLLSGGNDNTAILWDIRALADALILYNVHREPVTGVGFSHDSTVCMTSSYDGTVHIWDTVSLNSIRTLSYNRNTPVTQAQFTPNSRYVYASCLNSSIFMWDLLAPRTPIVRTYKGHVNEYFRTPISLSKCEESNYCLWSGSEDGTLHKWNLDNEAEHTEYRISDKDRNSYTDVINSFNTYNDMVLVSGYHKEDIKDLFIKLIKFT